MRKRTLLLAYVCIVAAAFGATKAFGATSFAGWSLVSPAPHQQKLVLGHSWGYYDVFVGKAAELAGHTFGVSTAWLQNCNHSEGGDVGRRALARSLVTGAQPGWNRAGSYAFGPWQYMMDRKPAPHWWDWGTFETYMVPAFAEAAQRGLHVPVGRFRRPDSYLGQAVVTAFMFRHGMSGQWTGGGC